MDRSGKGRTRREFFEDSAAGTLGGVLWRGLGRAGTNAGGGPDQPVKSDEGQNAKSFHLVTGDHALVYEPGMDYIAIYRKDELTSNIHLALCPGGWDPKLRVLDAANVRTITRKENPDGVRMEIRGVLNWCSYLLTLFLPACTPGLVNSRIEVKVTREIGPREGLFAGRHPELDYMLGKFNCRQENLKPYYRKTSPEGFHSGQGKDMNLWNPYVDWQFNPDFSWNRLIYYHNGTPGAKPYQAFSISSGAMPALNQLIYFGDPLVLKATLLYYEDFTTLNHYFQATGTRIRDTVRQPPGCMRSPLIYWGQPSAFGYDIPAAQAPLKQGDSMLVTNSFLHLAAGTPRIDEPTRYCRQFVEGIAAIYPLLEKPAPKFIDWPRVTEQGLQDMVAAEKIVAHPSFAPETNLSSCRRFAGRFGSERAKQAVKDGNALWAHAEQHLPFGDAWQYLFPLAMAGDYAQEFGSEAAKQTFLKAAADVVAAGRHLGYVFPLRINADFTVPGGSRYQYDCTGAYVYLMLLYHHFTGKADYMQEAGAAADRLLQMGCEFPYEFTTTALAPIALLRLYKFTGDQRYLNGIAIPLAALLRHTWLFNPDYGDYRGRTIFLLTEAMPGVYANGWEEATMMHYLNLFLLEGRDLLPAAVREMTCELLRWKGVSAADSLPAMFPDPSIIYTGTPRQWFIPVNHAWNIPLEGFGYLEWDDGAMQDKPGRVSQAPYCFGMLPEAALLLFHPLDGQATLYVEAPINIEKADATTFAFQTLGGQTPLRAALEGTAAALAGVRVQARDIGGSNSSHSVKLERDAKSSRLWFSVSPLVEHTISLNKTRM
jgi:hypothetical protein